jgi:hypothetical protein
MMTSTDVVVAASPTRVDDASESPEIPTLVIRPSRAKYIRHLIVALVFVAIGIAMSIGGAIHERLFAAIDILFFGACAIAFVRQIVDTKPRVIITDVGLLDRTLGVGIIPWDAIDDAHLSSIYGNAFIGLVMRDPGPWLSLVSTTKQKLASANEALGFQPININLSGTACDPVVVLATIRAHIAAARRDA